MTQNFKSLQAQYQDLHHYFNRTLLTAQLHKATATAYFGYRIYARGKNFRTETLRKNMNESLSEIKKVANLIKEYPEKPASGNWDWSADAERALKYYDWITHGTWPAKTNGFETGLDEIIYENMVTEVK